MNQFMTSRRKKILAIVAAATGVVGFLWSAYQGFVRIEHGEHYASVDWLPAEATDVCFFRSYSFTAYEFQISEKGFFKWASRWEVSPIAEPFEVLRYTLPLDAPRPGPDLTKGGAKEQCRAQSEWRARKYATITSGHCYKRTQSNGGVLQIAYDKDSGRAYYLSTPR